MGKWIKKNDGLTLVEILVSLAILAIIITPLTSLFLNTVKINANAKRNMVASQLAQQHMERWRTADISGLALPYRNTTEDTENSMLIETTIEIYKDGQFEIPTGSGREDNGNGENYPRNYHALVNLEDGILKIYDEKNQYIGSLETKKNGNTQVSMTIAAAEIRFSLQGKHAAPVIVRLNAQAVDVVIKSDDSARVQFHVIVEDGIDSVNVYVSGAGKENITILPTGKNHGLVRINPNTGGSEPNQDYEDLLYKITVVVTEKKGFRELAKFIGLKRIN